MSDPFLGEIRMFGGSFAPRGWALCNGQLLPVSQNSPLYSILGTAYGGNGTTNFALPDLRGRVPMHWGNGPGLSPRTLGEIIGTEHVTLISAQMPRHSHPLNVTGNDSSAKNPVGNFPGATGAPAYAPASTGAFNAAAVGVTGGDQPHPNIQPSVCLTFIIALEGIYPSRN